MVGVHVEGVTMHVRDITEQQFAAIADEIDNPVLQCGVIEMISGQHHLFGMTILLRDAERCMALVDDPTHLDLARTDRSADVVSRLN